MLFHSVAPCLSGNGYQKTSERSLSVISLSESVSDHSPLHWCNIWQGDLASVATDSPRAIALSRRWLGQINLQRVACFVCEACHWWANWSRLFAPQPRRIKRRNRYSCGWSVGSPRCWLFNDGSLFHLSPTRFRAVGPQANYKRINSLTQSRLHSIQIRSIK